MDAPTEVAAVQQLGERIDVLLDEVQREATPAVTAKVEELVRAVLSLHGAGLERLLGRLDEARTRDLLEDDLVAGLLLLHDLHPDDVGTRIQAALDRVRPYLGSHAGGIDYLGLDDDGVVHLRLQGSCDGCPGSTTTVRLTVENAVLDAAPEAVAVEVEGMVEATPRQTLLTIEPFRPHEESAGWHRLKLSVAPGEVQRVTGLDLFVANLAGTLFAYLNNCPVCSATLHTGALTGDELTCSRCATHYDVRLAGRAKDGGEPLEPLPLLPDGEDWKIAVPGRQPV
ncbi:Fe-S cluster biogenesis protein NfuA [Kribbella amoyensis]|uniref:Fe-S cluster biogenesis protein NfuA n=1 Tax=Kribbella amoyensis TaxID=996641 RepID=A0A561BSX5_9ACTN|nr:NifU family protein [Kribbella amoyensis]TWD81998.1 Fe-S cluster biogenesis protein NfuA [Kribbella amoyensis]